MLSSAAANSLEMGLGVPPVLLLSAACITCFRLFDPQFALTPGANTPSRFFRFGSDRVGVWKLTLPRGYWPGAVPTHTRGVSPVQVGGVPCELRLPDAAEEGV